MSMEIVPSVLDRHDEGASLTVRLAMAELDRDVVAARTNPRSISKAASRMMDLSGIDIETAKECMYALPRGGKPITGPSARFAEIVVACWGNCRVGGRVIDVDRQRKVVIAEAFFQDLETGYKRVQQSERKIFDKNGKIFNDDMIAVTGSAAISVAMREVVLKGVPKAAWRGAYERAQNVATNSTEPLKARVEKAIKAFEPLKVTEAMVFDMLEVGGPADVTIADFAVLTSIYSSIKSGEATVDQYFDLSKTSGPIRRTKPAEADPKPETEAKKAEEKVDPKPEANVSDRIEDAEVVDEKAADPEPAKSAGEGELPLEVRHPDRNKWERLADTICNDILDASDANDVMLMYADQIEAMGKLFPDLVEKIKASLPQSEEA